MSKIEDILNESRIDFCNRMSNASKIELYAAISERTALLKEINEKILEQIQTLNAFMVSKHDK